MSIDDQILALVRSGSLVPLSPKHPSDSTVRPLLLRPSLFQDIVRGPWDDERERIRVSVVLRADMDEYVTGQPLLVTLNNRKDGKGFLKRLSDVDEIWTLRSKKKDGIRVFGRFARKDTFIATHWEYRRFIKNRNDWAMEEARCIDIWQNLFQGTYPHTGTKVSDYVSNAQDTKYI